MLTLYGTVTIYRGDSPITIPDGREWRVDELDPLQPITIPEGADFVWTYGRRSHPPGKSCIGPSAGEYYAEPKNDWTYAVTIYPGYDLRYGYNGSDRICHHCYAAKRMIGAPVESKGPLKFTGMGCHSCGRTIPSFRQAKPPYLAKKRPAYWER